jgi:hypothetical protein
VAAVNRTAHGIANALAASDGHNNVPTPTLEAGHGAPGQLGTDVNLNGLLTPDNASSNPLQADIKAAAQAAHVLQSQLGSGTPGLTHAAKEVEETIEREVQQVQDSGNDLVAM